MDEKPKNKFSARIYNIGVNPYVLLPKKVLREIFRQAKKDKGPIPVCGTLNKKKFIQTLVKYNGKWRLYLNTPMRKATGTDVGDLVQIEMKYDPKPRTIAIHPKLQLALDQNVEAKKVLGKLSPSRQKEIMRYIGLLKSEEAVDKNVNRAIQYLLGKGNFVGQDKI